MDRICSVIVSDLFSQLTPYARLALLGTNVSQVIDREFTISGTVYLTGYCVQFNAARGADMTHSSMVQCMATNQPVDSCNYNLIIVYLL